MLKPNDLETVTRWDNENFVHPWEGMGSIGENDRTFVEGGEGVYVVNENGERLIDGPGGMWCVQIGYGRDDMAEAIADQARQLAYFSPFNNTNSVSSRLAHEIAARTPGDLNHVFFTTGGSTAVDSALRFIQFRNNLLGQAEKKIVISRHKAYHGSTYLAASVSGKERDRLWLNKVDGLTHFLPDVNPMHRADGTSMDAFLEEKVQDLENAILKLGADKVAAFIAEPILASGGVIVPPPGYHKRCLEICRRHDVLYISDEVVTGFGRLGHWFASEDVFGITPDIITCAKGMTSGYVPMGAAIISDRLIADVSGDASRGATFSNGYTYSGHPVSAAAALKNIEIFESEGILEHVRAVTPLFQDRLKALGDHPIVSDARGMGLMGCVQCFSGDEDSLERDYALGGMIDDHCQANGLILRPIINMCVFSPPLVINEVQINQMFDILAAGIQAAADALSKG
ncbi:aminotransferase [Alisedimentitalea sp. MJ-SS2]|uniref:aminotransferase n=1 Tax=Aliisedimentitalea sp. MJ-SS2 TaxID=3049795 RepID=UPI002911A34B|nr:aminotransferase [Alisedimentitalea sp. MJ-SS2]MDU8929955.1 aminotransferase [Alisedimentitalea sp. MJ-SS2]